MRLRKAIAFLVGLFLLGASLHAQNTVKVGPARILAGTGNPEGVVTANIGDVFICTSSCSAGTIWTKRSGSATNTGWMLVRDYAPLYDAGNSGTSFTLDWNNGKAQVITMTGNVTAVTLSNPVDGTRYTILIKTGAGSFTLVGWPAAVLWPGGTAPTVTATASKVDLIVCIYDGTATKYYCAYNQNF